MKKFLIIFIVLSVFSCREDPTLLKQRDLIPRRKLVNMLVEIHLMDAITADMNHHSFFPGGDSVHIYTKIFEKYKVTPAEFDSTIAMYSRRPDLFVKIYNDVILKLNHISDTVNKDDPQYLQDHSPTYIER
jgi:hypothetical protein